MKNLPLSVQEIQKQKHNEYPKTQDFGYIVLSQTLRIARSSNTGEAFTS